jgi:hypothetical protein
MSRVVFSSLMVAGVSWMLADASRASPVIRVEDAGAGVGVVIADQGAGDANPVSGAVTYVGGAGQFTMNVVTGQSMPVMHGLDLAGFSVTATGPGTLRIAIEDSFFPGGGSGSILSAIGGTFSAPAGSTLVAQTWVDANNQLMSFGPLTNPAGPLAPLGGAPGGSTAGFTTANATFGPGAFSGTNTTGFAPSGNYSLMGVVTVTFTGAGSAGFNLSILGPTPQVPEPAALLVWSLLGALGMGTGGVRAWLLRK